MNQSQPLFDDGFNEANAAREKSVYLYFRALERGDNQTLSRILKEAETDAQLEAMLYQGHQLEIADIAERESEEAAQVLVDALENAFPNKVLQTPEPVFHPAPPLTVADVAARLQTDESAQGKLISAPDSQALQALSQMREANLPSRLTPREVKKFFAALGLQTTQRFQEQFKDAAVFLKMGRGQSTYLAATRSTQPRKKEVIEHDTKEETR